MGKNPDIMATPKKNGVPKRSQWIKKLVDPYEEKLWKRAKKKIIKPNKVKGPYSESRWKELIGTSKHDSEGGQRFLEKLEKWGALRDEGLRTNGQPHRVYSLDESRVVKAFSETEFYRVNRDLFLKAVDAEESRFKVVKDY